MKKLVRLLARKRDLNSKGRGTEEYRKITIPDAQGNYPPLEWLTNAGSVIKDTWTPRGRLAAQRRCRTEVEIEVPTGPKGAIVVDITKRIGYSSRSPAQLTAGFLPEDIDPDKITVPDWATGIESVGQRKNKDGTFSTIIRLSDGRTLTV